MLRARIWVMVLLLFSNSYVKTFRIRTPIHHGTSVFHVQSIPTQISEIQNAFLDAPKQMNRTVFCIVSLPGEVYSNTTRAVNSAMQEVTNTVMTIQNIPSTIQITVQKSKEDVASKVLTVVTTVTTLRRSVRFLLRTVGTIARGAVDFAYDLSDKKQTLLMTPSFDTLEQIDEKRIRVIRPKFIQKNRIEDFKESFYSTLDKLATIIGFMRTTPTRIQQTIEAVERMPQKLQTFAEKLAVYVEQTWFIISLHSFRSSLRCRIEELSKSMTDPSISSSERLLRGMEILLLNPAAKSTTPSPSSKRSSVPIKSSPVPVSIKKFSTISFSIQGAIAGSLSVLRDIRTETEKLQRRYRENREMQGLTRSKTEETLVGVNEEKTERKAQLETVGMSAETGKHHLSSPSTSSPPTPEISSVVQEPAPMDGADICGEKGSAGEILMRDSVVQRVVPRGEEEGLNEGQGEERKEQQRALCDTER